MAISVNEESEGAEVEVSQIAVCEGRATTELFVPPRMLSVCLHGMLGAEPRTS